MFLKVSRRLAWAISLAGIALWVAAPVSWGQEAPETVVVAESQGQRILGCGQDDKGDGQDDKGEAPCRMLHLAVDGAEDLRVDEDAADLAVGGGKGVSVVVDGLDLATLAWPCDPPWPLPQGPGAQGTASTAASATTAPAPADQSVSQATFRLCGTADPQAERAIEQLIAGRSFSATLIGRPDNCAELTIKVMPQSAPVSAGSRQSTNLSVSTGSGGAVRRVSIQIVSESGATRASIAPGA